MAQQKSKAKAKAKAVAHRKLTTQLKKVRLAKKDLQRKETEYHKALKKRARGK